MGVVPAPLVFFWTLVGAAVGALVAALVARNQFVGARREHRTQLRRRDLALERLKKELEEDRSDYRQRSDDYLRELAASKRERSSLASDLEETRRTLATLESNLEMLRASARESESRLSSALDAAREEAAARRASAAEELRTVQEAADRARNELSRRLADLEKDRSRLEADLANERRTNAERQESLRSILATLREQYTLATTERDTLTRELEAERSRAAAAEAEAQRTREEYSRRLDAEHQESMAMISQVWEYVRSYLHAHPADLPPEAEPPVAAGATPHAERGERGAEASVAKQGQRGADASAAEQRPGPLTTDREVEAPHARTIGDLSATDDYDIERALEETLTTESAAASEPASEQPKERGWRPVPPPAGGTTRVRRPISAMRRGDDVLVVCDDGSVWLRRPTGWIEEPPIPGSDANGQKSNTGSALKP